MRRRTGLGPRSRNHAECARARHRGPARRDHEGCTPTASFMNRKPEDHAANRPAIATISGWRSGQRHHGGHVSRPDQVDQRPGSAARRRAASGSRAALLGRTHLRAWCSSGSPALPSAAHPERHQQLERLVGVAREGERREACLLHRRCRVPRAARGSASPPGARRARPCRPGNSQSPASCLPSGRWAISTRPSASIRAQAATRTIFTASTPAVSPPLIGHSSRRGVPTASRSLAPICPQDRLDGVVLLHGHLVIHGPPRRNYSSSGSQTSVDGDDVTARLDVLELEGPALVRPLLAHQLGVAGSAGALVRRKARL